MHQVEAYTATGVICGSVARSGGPWDGLRTGARVTVEQVVWYPMDGGPPERRGQVDLSEDDVQLAVVEIDDLGVHSIWHPIVLDVGSYRVTGELPTPPGFDPNRALARPGGTFVALRAVRIEVLDRPGMGMVERDSVLVNRYAVDRVAADLFLGFYFPGARLETPQGVPAS